MYAIRSYYGYIYNDKATEGSSLIKALPLSDLNAVQAYAFIRALPDAYRRYVTERNNFV